MSIRLTNMDFQFHKIAKQMHGFKTHHSCCSFTTDIALASKELHISATKATCQSVSLDVLDPVPWTLFLFPFVIYLLNVYLALYGPPLPPAQCWTGCRFNKLNQIQTSVIYFQFFAKFMNLMRCAHLIKSTWTRLLYFYKTYFVKHWVIPTLLCAFDNACQSCGHWGPQTT